MVKIDVSDATYKMIEQASKPFVDKSPEDVIVRLLTKAAATSASANEYAVKTPDLTHTRVTFARVNGTMMLNRNWNAILHHVIRVASAKLKDPQLVSALILVSHFVGEKKDQGYRYFSDVGISVQGQDSNNAWRAASHIISELGISAEVRFKWYENADAAKPGEDGRFLLNIAA